jgi:hypothetical protein
MSGGLAKIPPQLIAALVILIFGSVADFAFTSPQSKRLSVLELQRNQLLAELAVVESRDAQMRQVANSLGYESMAGALQSIASRDPIVFLTESVDAAGLTRGELSTRATKEVGTLRRTEFLLVVRGSFGRVNRLLANLEDGARLTTIDGIVITPLGSNPIVEARINLSIYDPGSGGGKESSADDS